jgi:hypothetical protein
MLASTVGPGPEAMDQYGGELADVEALPLEGRESLSTTDRDCRLTRSELAQAAKR